MTIPPRGSVLPVAYPQSSPESSANRGQVPAQREPAQELLARRHVLGRAYPVAKELAEILELEDPELAAIAKRLRQQIGIALGSPVDDR